LSAAAAYQLKSFAGEVHRVLRLLAHEPAFLRRAQGRIPEPVVEILVRSQLPCSAPEGDDFTQDRAHPPAGRDCRLQISRNVDLWDAFQRVEEAAIGRNVGAHRLAFLSLAHGERGKCRAGFHSAIMSLIRSCAPTAAGHVDGSGHARNEFAARLP
jgi:hypothetical protein